MKKLVMLGLVSIMALLIITQTLGQMTYDNDLRLAWYWGAAKGNIQRYNVYASLDSGTYVLIGTAPTAATLNNPYYLSGEAAKVYRLQVEAEDAQGLRGPKSEPSEPAMCTPGDANYDGWVELTDFSLVSRHWQRLKGDPYYNAAADLNDDGIIDVEDMSLVSRYWGNVYYNGAPGRQPSLLSQDTLGWLEISGLVQGPELLEIKIRLEKARGVKDIGFNIIIPGCQIEEIKKGGLLNKEVILWGLAPPSQAATILVSFDQPQTSSGELVVVKARISQGLTDWQQDSLTLTLRHGQLAGPLGKSSFCAAIKTISLKPQVSSLGQNYPNPFNPDTWLPYQLKQGVEVIIKIYGSSGQLVRTLKLGYKPAGFYLNKPKAAYWDGKNEAGEKVASGVYFYTLQAGKFTQVRKMVIH